MHEGTKLHKNKIAQRYFCTKTSLHAGTKLHKDYFARVTVFHGGSILHKNYKPYDVNFYFGNGLKLHKDTFAQRLIYTRGQNCKKTILHQGSFLHSSRKNIYNKKLTDNLIKKFKKVTDRG